MIVFLHKLKEVMKNSIKFLVFLLTLFFAVSFYSCIFYPSKTVNVMKIGGMDDVPNIRVCLKHASYRNKCKLSIYSDFKIMNYELNNEQLMQSSPIMNTNVYVKNGYIKLGNTLRDYPDIIIKPFKEGSISINDRFYRGYLLLHINEKKGLEVINIVNIEAYLLSVIGGEMNPETFGMAALKAQAVAARSYAFAEMGDAKKINRKYDVYDDTSSQVYFGITYETKQTRAAILKTKGQTLFFDGELVKTYFHSTCGGKTRPGYEIFNCKDILPLSGRKCEYCKGTKYYKWQIILKKRYVLNLLFNKKLIPNLAKEALFSVELQKSGYVKSVIVKPYLNSTKTVLYKIPVNSFRYSIGTSKLRSPFFTINDKDNIIEITGWGWGHGVGMCQMGAKGMAENGFDYVDILNYYYPGAELYSMY